MTNGSPVLSHDDPVMTTRSMNPFVRMAANEKTHGDGSMSRGDVITRRILAPAQPAVVYSDDSKSAAILSTLLKSKVPKVEKEVRVVERTRASVVPLLGLRDKVATFLGGTEVDVRKHVSSSSFSDGKDQKALPVQGTDRSDRDDEVVVIEEINLVSSSSDDGGDGVRGRGRGQQEAEGGREQVDDQLKYSREETPSRMRSTGVALFDAFTADEDYYEDEIEEYEEEFEDDEQMVERTEMKSPSMVDINGTMQPWWKRFPDFVPVSELASGRDPRNGSTVFVNYMSQFKGTKIAQVGMSSRKSTTRKRSGGHWVSKGGERCFVTDFGENLTGRAAYVAYKKAKPSSGRSKQSTRKRRRKKPKKKS